MNKPNNTSSKSSLKKPLIIGAVSVAALAFIGGGYALKVTLDGVKEMQIAQAAMLTSIYSKQEKDAQAISPENLSATLDSILEKKAVKRKAEELKKFEAIAKQNQKAWEESFVGDKGGYFFGSKDARFTILEYTDFECPYCKQFHDTPPAVVNASSGSVNWELRHLPLSFHGQIAVQEAMLAECIGEQQGSAGFFAASALIFKNTKGNGGGISDFEAIAKQSGADPEKALSCVSSGKFSQKVNAQKAEANELGITGTPASIVIDNVSGRRTIVSGAVPATEIITRLSALAKLEIESKTGKNSTDQAEK